jgi:hypothetical protein
MGNVHGLLFIYVEFCPIFFVRIKEKGGINRNCRHFGWAKTRKFQWANL